MNEPKNIQFEKHWGSWAEGFLKLAEKGLLYLKNQKNIGKVKWFKNQPKKLFDLGIGHMIIAIIWNIKHGIELLIKALGINLNKQYWKKHDLDFLIKDLELKMKDFCIEKHFQLLEQLIRKYYECNFSQKTIFVDKENTFFKYPELDSVSVSLDYSFVHELKRKDINQFLRDIHNLKKLYSLLEGQPQ